jgi:signal transduction histidine kinase
MRHVPQTFAPANIRDQVANSNAVPVEMQAFERELLEARAKLRDFMLAQDRLISNISHEVNTPIAIVLTESQTLDQRALPEEGRAFVLSVQAEMRHLRRTVDSFLLLTKLRTGKQITRPRPWHINDVMMDAIRAVTLAAETAGVSFRLELAPDAAMAADGEPELIRVMFEHLLFNAIRHAGTMRQVGVATSTQGDVCTVVITDGGAHVAPDTLLHMFHRYQTVEESPGRNPGLGLAIAQGLAELHSGSISAANRAEGGCEYTVTLPLNRGAAPASRQHVQSAQTMGN